MAVEFRIEKITDEQTGQVLDAVVKVTTSAKYGDEPTETKETWCTILDLDRLFEGCVRRWGNNWNLDKVLTAISESEID